MMEELVELGKTYSNHKRLLESGDDECSTDSGCSSRGSTISAERIARTHRRGEISLPRKCYSHEFPADGLSPAGTYENRFTRFEKKNQRSKSTTALLRSWSPCQNRKHMSTSSTQSSSSPSDDQSTDSDSLKRTSKTDILTKALHYLKVGTSVNNEKSEEKLKKKNPKRILRDPVTYTYVKGLSGLPTQRVPRGHNRSDFSTNNSSHLYNYKIQRISNQ
uniref:DUF4797 domain-containing protein n=1 Tax=Bracon brevicornis TaxID=1563983 RepID=A0A6V7K5X0_9HYME